MTVTDSPQLQTATASPPGRYRLIGAPGCGSAVVEAALAMAGVDADREDLAWDDDGGVLGDRIDAVNPLREVPVLILPDGTVMTESGAMILHLADRAPGSGVAPPPGAPDRAVFLHRLMLITGSIYPTHVGGPLGRQAADLLVARRKQLWRWLDAEVAGADWLAGPRFSALDLYAAVMTRWTPGPDWFAAECPAVAGIAWRAAGHPAVTPVIARHFPA
ncbi:MAG: glutathione S-transferase [Alphaproteobacteria bacterium]|jgi:GST-like protein|nr:glutathione S-transferase [Alphaproteobacteria bacterium]